MTREELEEKAESLGIDVDGRWSDETLEKKIQEEAQPKTEVKSEQFVNAKKWLFQLSDGSYIKPGAVATLTDEQLKLADVKRAIETGMLVAK